MTERADVVVDEAAPPPPAALGTGAAGRPSAPARALITLIHAYRGLRQGRPSPCRFVPSCSAYGLEAVSRHGATRGTWLTLRRLARCRPFGASGLDPVPD
ncbi:MAG TPA: membrane protein insertion efficiency factor YidD [Acidimicrobiales bacterium]|nr:membrane protein insertion efficiency factor YidD [Acidimicrobiales bacterium]